MRVAPLLSRFGWQRNQARLNFAPDPGVAQHHPFKPRGMAPAHRLPGRAGQRLILGRHQIEQLAADQVAGAVGYLRCQAGSVNLKKVPSAARIAAVSEAASNTVRGIASVSLMVLVDSPLGHEF